MNPKEGHDSIMKWRRAECPYCGKKVGLLKCWIIKSQGEYRCPQCGGYSNIVLNSVILLLALLAVLISGVLYAAQLLFIRSFSWQILLLVFLPFLLFYILSVFMVGLRKPAVRKKPSDSTSLNYKIEPPNTGSPGSEPNGGGNHTDRAETSRPPRRF